MTDEPSEQFVKMLPLQLFEQEGAIFRGYHRHTPLELWNEREQHWERYRGTVPKPIEWGTPISEEDAVGYMKPRAR